MQAVKFKTKITADHQVLLPDEVPEGDAEVIAMYAKQDETPAGEGLLAFLESLDGKDYPRRSMQEITAYIQKERDSWDVVTPISSQGENHV